MSALQNKQQTKTIRWEAAEVASPHLSSPVPVIAAKHIPYLRDGNRLQNLSIYLPKNSETTLLPGLPVSSLPTSQVSTATVKYQVYVHGGAWREPSTNADTIEPMVAHAFSSPDESALVAIASLNYSLSPHPKHATDPYDPTKSPGADPSREAIHPQHVHDIYRGLEFLRSFGLSDGSYILSGHSCGASLVLQAALQSPSYYGIKGASDIPRPAALLGMNGVYDLSALVHDLDAAHKQMSGEFEAILSNAFGKSEDNWSKASPAKFDADQISEKIREGKVPSLVVLDQSRDDQVVPTNQYEMLLKKLRMVDGIRVIEGDRCTGLHATPWQEGLMIWDSVRDVLAALRSQSK